MTKGQKADGRVNRRSPRYRAGEPAKPAPKKGTRKAAEDAPLVYEPGRTTPVTDEEALHVLRRKRKAELEEAYADAGPAELKAAKLPPTLAQALKDPKYMPTELSRWDVAKQPIGMRLPKPLIERLNALAEIEDVFLTTEVELAVWKLLKEPPRDPKVRREEYLAYLRETIGADRALAMLDKMFGSDS